MVNYVVIAFFVSSLILGPLKSISATDLLVAGPLLLWLVIPQVLGWLFARGRDLERTYMWISVSITIPLLAFLTLSNFENLAYGIPTRISMSEFILFYRGRDVAFGGTLALIFALGAPLALGIIPLSRRIEQSLRDVYWYLLGERPTPVHKENFRPVKGDVLTRSFFMSLLLGGFLYLLALQFQVPSSVTIPSTNEQIYVVPQIMGLAPLLTFLIVAYQRVRGKTEDARWFLKLLVTSLTGIGAVVILLSSSFKIGGLDTFQPTMLFAAPVLCYLTFPYVKRWDKSSNFRRIGLFGIAMLIGPVATSVYTGVIATSYFDAVLALWLQGAVGAGFATFLVIRWLSRKEVNCGNAVVTATLSCVAFLAVMLLRYLYFQGGIALPNSSGFYLGLGLQAACVVAASILIGRSSEIAVVLLFLSFVTTGFSWLPVLSAVPLLFLGLFLKPRFAIRNRRVAAIPVQAS